MILRKVLINYVVHQQYHKELQNIYRIHLDKKDSWNHNILIVRILEKGRVQS